MNNQEHHNKTRHPTSHLQETFEFHKMSHRYFYKIRGFRYKFTRSPTSSINFLWSKFFIKTSNFTMELQQENPVTDLLSITFGRLKYNT